MLLGQFVCSWWHSLEVTLGAGGGVDGTLFLATMLFILSSRVVGRLGVWWDDGGDAVEVIASLIFPLFQLYCL